ncbi:MAG: hypothetical protein JWN67_2280 [Actinomycetia bacterium]|nr:hypothetical protein [Actinomycetes bacterium]
MLLWFAGMAFVCVWAVFKDPAIDHRLVVVGALLPDGIDVWSGGRWVAHTVLFSIVLLTVVMLATRGRRILRRQLLALPIGTFLHLVLDGMWADKQVFWWPVYGSSFGDRALPSISRGWFDLPLELLGLVALVWAWRRFRLAEPERRAYFLRTGRLGRDLVP